MKGYAGKIAYINLTEQKVSIEKLTEETARKYLGGKGLGAYLLYCHLKPGTDTKGPSSGQVVDRHAFEKMLDEYYEIVGWDIATGIPTEKRLKELGIER